MMVGICLWEATTLLVSKYAVGRWAGLWLICSGHIHALGARNPFMMRGLGVNMIRYGTHQVEIILLNVSIKTYLKKIIKNIQNSSITCLVSKPFSSLVRLLRRDFVLNLYGLTRARKLTTGNTGSYTGNANFLSTDHRRKKNQILWLHIKLGI